MTFEQLLNTDTEKLKAMSDEELERFIGPIIKDEPIAKSASEVEKYLEGVDADDDCPIKKTKKKSGLKVRDIKDEASKMMAELDAMELLEEEL